MLGREEQISTVTVCYVRSPLFEVVVGHGRRTLGDSDLSFPWPSVLDRGVGLQTVLEPEMRSLGVGVPAATVTVVGATVVAPVVENFALVAGLDNLRAAVRRSDLRRRS